MPEVEKFVAIGKVQKPCADSIQADFRTSRQKISTDFRRRRAGGLLAGSILHSVDVSDSIILPNSSPSRNDFPALTKQRRTP